MNNYCCDNNQASPTITSGDGKPVKDCTSRDGDLYLDTKSRNMYIYTHGQWALLPDNRALGGSRVFITDMDGKELNGGSLIAGPAHDGNFISQPYDIIMRMDNENIIFLEQIDAHDFKLIYYFSPLAALNDIKTIKKLSEKVSIQNENGETRTTLGGLVDSVDKLSSKRIYSNEPIAIKEDGDKGTTTISLELPNGMDLAAMKTLYVEPQDSPHDNTITMYPVLNKVVFFHKKDAINGQGYPSTMYVKPMTHRIVDGNGIGIGSMADFITGSTTAANSSNLVMQCMGGHGIISTSSFMVFYNYDLNLKRLVVSTITSLKNGIYTTPEFGEDLQYPTMNDLPKQ